MAVLQACAAPVTPPKQPDATAKPVVSGETRRAKEPVADDLYRRLTEQKRGEAVLTALPGDVRALVDRRVQALSNDQRRALLDPAEPYAYQRPIMHLVAGGDAIGAYSALFSSSAAADELVDARYESGRFEDLPPVVTEVAKRAARHVLARRAPDVAPGVKRKKEVLGEIAAAAEFLGDDPIYVAALAALEREFPDQQWAFMRAGALARSLRPDDALAALPRQKEVDAGMARSAEVLIAAAQQASKPVQTPEEAVSNARAQLMLDREQAALEVLKPFAAQSSQHLALAATDLRALSGTGPCPTVRTPLGNGVLCRTAWQAFLTPERLALLQRAWESGAGRDAESVDVWLGLSHVVPMMYGLQENAEQAMAHLKALAEGARAAVDVGPQYQGIELFAQTLESAMGANSAPSPGAAVGEIPKTTRKALFERAVALGTKQPNDSWIQAASLATVAVTAPFEDGRTVLSRMNDTVRAEWRITHGSLLIWNLLAAGDVNAFVQNKGVLGRAAQVSAEGSYERSRWVILWAEAEAHLEPSERSHGIVAELAQRLDSDRAPLDLRLRTALDAAGLKARKGELLAAADLLGPLVSSTPRGAVSTRQEQELLVAATGYEHVLRALATTGDERTKHVAALDELMASVTRAAAAPPALREWLALWRAELERQIQKSACNGERGCELRAQKLNRISNGALDPRLGRQMANLMRRGVLPIGGVALEFRYRGGRLAPQVDVDPAFLLVHMPPLDGPAK